MAIYPVPVFHFAVEWGGTQIGFSEVSGLTLETEVIEYRNGASVDFGKIRMPGLKKYGNVTLKRGIIPADNQFYDWLNSTKMNKPDRRDLTIMLLNEEHAPIMVWKVNNCWPVKVEGPSLKSDGNEVAIESIELAHEGIAIETVGV